MIVKVILAIFTRASAQQNQDVSDRIARSHNLYELTLRRTACQASILCGIAADRLCGRVHRCAMGAASLHLPRLQQLHILLLHRGLIALDSLLADSPRLLRCLHLFPHRCARLCMCCRALWLDFTDRKDSVEDALLTQRTSAALIKAYLLGLLAMIKCSICSYQCDN